jgi:hypothetical protein
MLHFIVIAAFILHGLAHVSGFMASWTWWNTVVAGAKVGAVFDVLVLIALLLPWRDSVMAAVQ